MLAHHYIREWFVDFNKFTEASHHQHNFIKSNSIEANT